MSHTFVSAARVDFPVATLRSAFPEYTSTYRLIFRPHIFYWQITIIGESVIPTQVRIRSLLWFLFEVLGVGKDTDFEVCRLDAVVPLVSITALTDAYLDSGNGTFTGSPSPYLDTHGEVDEVTPNFPNYTDLIA